MSAPDIFDDLPDDPDALAAEFVLRLLTPEDEALCAARMGRDPVFAEAVARWQGAFSALDAEFAPMTPPPRLLAQVEGRLFGTPPSLLARLWGSAGLWRGVAAAAVASAVVLAVLGRPVEQPAAPELVATVAAPAGTVQLVVLLDRAAGELRFSRLAGTAAPGRSLELWLLPAGATAPVSLGVMPADDRFALAVPAGYADRVAPGTAIIVSDEVAGGSPTGQPQGTVLAQGAITAL